MRLGIGVERDGVLRRVKAGDRVLPGNWMKTLGSAVTAASAGAISPARASSGAISVEGSGVCRSVSRAAGVGIVDGSASVGVSVGSDDATGVGVGDENAAFAAVDEPSVTTTAIALVIAVMRVIALFIQTPQSSSADRYPTGLHR